MQTFLNIIRRLDGSYQINKEIPNYGTCPYHVPDEGTFASEWEQINAYALEHPDEVTAESPPPPPTLEELKTQKLNALEQAFTTRVSGSFVCSHGYPMQFNRSDCVAVQGAIELLQATGTAEGYLTDANDVTHYAVPLATVQAVMIEMLGAYSQCHSHKQTLRAQITAAADQVALDAVQITWPV